MENGNGKGTVRQIDSGAPDMGILELAAHVCSNVGEFSQLTADMVAEAEAISPNDRDSSEALLYEISNVLAVMDPQRFSDIAALEALRTFLIPNVTDIK